jgi:hypothetical protein
MMKLRAKLAICAFAGLSIVLPGLAQDMRTASEKVVACQTVTDPVERLACFEAAAAELSAVLEIPVAEAPVPSAPAAPRGTPAPVVPAAPVEPDEFAKQLTRIQVNRLGRHFFTTAEGHVWRQKSPEEIRAPKTLPADVVIYQNITGGLRLKIVETNRSYPVRRVE